MSDHWATPPRILRALRRRYGIKQERFAPPLNFDVEGGEYWSAHGRDRIFGAHYDAYSSRFSGGSVYMNPEYERVNDLLKALKWAVWSCETRDPTCIVAVFPRWKKDHYLNLLKHDIVKVVARFARDTFGFLPPDHWMDSRTAGKAEWHR